MMNTIEKYILDNYTSPEFPQKYETFIHDNYQDIVPDLILGDEKLTDITNGIIKGEEVDDNYLGTFKDYYGESVYEPEVDFLKLLALEARYIDDNEYLEWLNDDKMAKVLAEFTTRGDLIDHLGPTIEEIHEKYDNDPNLDLLINNMTYKSHPLAFYEFSQSDDFSEGSDFDINSKFKKWAYDSKRSVDKIKTQIRNENSLSEAIEDPNVDTQVIQPNDSSEQDTAIAKNISKNRGYDSTQLEPVPKSNIREISEGMRPDRNQNDPGSGDKSMSEGDMALRAPRITTGMVNTLSATELMRADKRMERNSRKAVMQQAKQSFKGINTGKAISKGEKLSPYLKGSLATAGVMLAAPVAYKFIKNKIDESRNKINQQYQNYKLHEPDYNQEYARAANFSLVESLTDDIERSYKLSPHPLNKKDRKLIEACVKYVIDAIVLGRLAKYKDMSLSPVQKVALAAIPASTFIGAQVYDKLKNNATKKKIDNTYDELEKLAIYKQAKKEKNVVKPILYTLTGLTSLGAGAVALGNKLPKFEFSEETYNLRTSMNSNGKLDVYLIDPKTKKIKVKFRDVDFDDKANPKEIPDDATPLNLPVPAGKSQDPNSDNLPEVRQSTLPESNGQDKGGTVSQLPALRQDNTLVARSQQQKHEDPIEADYEIVDDGKPLHNTKSSFKDKVTGFFKNVGQKIKGAFTKDKPAESENKKPEQPQVPQIEDKTKSQEPQKPESQNEPSKDPKPEAPESTQPSAKESSPKVASNTNDPDAKFRESMRAKGYTDEQINKEMNSFKYRLDSARLDRYKRKNDSKQAMKEAYGFTDPEPVAGEVTKKGKKGKSEVYKLANKAMRAYGVGQATKAVGRGIGAVGRGFLALAAPQTNYNRPSVN